MNYSGKSFPITNIPEIKAKILRFISEHSTGVYLDSNNHSIFDKYSRFDLLAATEPEQILLVKANELNEEIFDQLLAFTKDHWTFGVFAYDFKNHLEDLHSDNQDIIGFPDLLFFRPSTVISLSDDVLTIYSTHEPETIFFNISAIEISEATWIAETGDTNYTNAKEDYIDTILKIKEHIREGDIYEMNYCQAFQMDGKIRNPHLLFEELNKKMASPFSAFFQMDEFNLICMSPERYICKRGDKIISQPIKGTARRGNSEHEDDVLRQGLANSEKNKAENVMIVDLVRNDFSRVCEPGSVVVEELFGIHTFEKVIQMISTVSGKLNNELGFIDLLKASFPMGSMTGAPKVRSMQLIEEYESFRRSWYSGCFGYIDPMGDFDFNVIIRSILYNQTLSKIMFPAGGAIVFDSEPLDEYDEKFLKIRPIIEAFFPYSADSFLR